jgi:hypothetical protein
MPQLLLGKTSTFQTLFLFHHAPPSQAWFFYWTPQWLLAHCSSNSHGKPLSILGLKNQSRNLHAVVRLRNPYLFQKILRRF